MSEESDISEDRLRHGAAAIIQRHWIGLALSFVSVCSSLCVSHCVLLQVKTGMTMTEKILAKAAEKSQVVPGDNIWVNVDVLMTHDVCGPGAFGIFKREFGEKAKVLIFFLNIVFSGYV